MLSDEDVAARYYFRKVDFFIEGSTDRKSRVSFTKEMSIHEWFKPLDWIVLFGYLGLTTWVGHRMRGRQASISDFFAGGRSLPWLAVSGSIVATEISGVTFIGVPGGVLAAGGDFTYLIWALGSILGRVIVGFLFTKVFYEENVYSPYDYMGRRIKPQLRTLATVFFTIGSILAQSVRVLVAAIPLMIVTPFSFEACILLIGAFAIGWTLMGGMRTVIWTDVMQFFLFAVGGLITLIWAGVHLGGGGWILRARREKHDGSTLMQECPMRSNLLSGWRYSLFLSSTLEPLAWTNLMRSGCFAAETLEMLEKQSSGARSAKV